MLGAPLHRIAITTAVLIGCCLSRAEAQDFLARSGWQLELFGDDVAILRTDLISPSKGRAGQLLLSCDGDQRRIRLSLAEPAHALPKNVRTGRALIRRAGVGRPLPDAIMSSFTIDRERVLSFVRQPDDGNDAALQLASLLRTKPAQLELMLHYGSAPITMRRSVSYSVAFGFQGSDNAALAGFIAACRRHAGSTSH